MLENLNFRAFFVRIVAMTSVQNREKLLLWIGMVFSLLFIVKLYFRLKK